MNSKIEEKNEEILNTIFKVCENIEYKVNNIGIVIVLEKQDHKIQRFFRKLKFKIPLYKEIQLDEISSTVFLQIDGCKTVKEIGVNLKEKFGDKVDPLYERLLVFLNYINYDCKYIKKVQ